MPSQTSLIDKLPGFYRRNATPLLKAVLAVAEEKMAHFRKRLTGQEDDLRHLLDVLRDVSDEKRLPASASGGGPRTGGGIQAEVTEWFRRHGRQPPDIWPGLDVQVESPKRLRFSRTWRPAVVLVWTSDQLGAPPATLMLPEWLMSADCEARAVWLSKPPRPCPPFPGSIVPGQRIVVSRKRVVYS